jgi:hypothetical protein
MISIFAMVLIGIAVLFVLLLLYIIIETYFLYPHEFNLKLVTKGTPIVIRTRAREIGTRTNKPEWQLLYKKLRVPVPDAKDRSITKRGKFSVEGWLFSDNQVQFERNQKIDGLKYEEIPDAVPSEVFTTEQRTLLVNQFKKAEIERGKNLKEWLMQIALPLGMFLILAMVIVFALVQWPDIQAGALEANKIESNMVSQLNEMSKRIENMNNNVQILTSRAGLDTSQSEANAGPPN